MKALASASTSASPRTLGRENEARLSKLRRALRETPGFSFVIVTVEAGVGRDELLRRLRAWSGFDDVPRLRQVSAVEIGSLEALAEEGEGLVLVESEVSTDEARCELARSLNWQRDGLRRAVSGPLLLVIGHAGHQALFEQAPDLYSWRRHSIAIVPDLPPFFVESKPRAVQRDKALRRRLEETLRELSERGALPAVAEAELKIRISYLLMREGLGVEAEVAWQGSGQVFQVEGDIAGMMIARLVAAEAFLVQDDRERAAEMLQLLSGEAVKEIFACAPESLGRFGEAGIGASVRLAMLVAYLRNERAPREALNALEEVEESSCDAHTRAALLFMQAMVLQRLGESQTAVEKAERASALYDELDDIMGQTQSFVALSLLHRAQGALPEAFEALEHLEKRTASWSLLEKEQVDFAARAIRELTVSQPVEASPTLSAGGVAGERSPALAMLRVKAALEHELSESALEKIHAAEAALAELPRELVLGLLIQLTRFRAEVELALGHLAKARETAESVEGLAESSFRVERGRARLLRGAIAVQEGAVAEALALFHAAEIDLFDGDDLVSLATARLGQGYLLHEAGKHTDAVRLLEESLQMLLDLGRPDDARRPAELLGRARDAAQMAGETVASEE